MSRSLCLVVLCFAGACGADPKSDEPTTAKEKQRLEAKVSAEDDDGGSKNWRKWRYKGNRDACFFIVGSSCFKTENAACQTARCKKPKKCTSVGAAPATVSCK